MTLWVYRNHQTPAARKERPYSILGAVPHPASSRSYVTAPFGGIPNVAEGMAGSRGVAKTVYRHSSVVVPAIRLTAASYAMIEEGRILTGKIKDDIHISCEIAKINLTVQLTRFR